MTADLDGVIEVFQRAIREVASRDYDPAQVAAWSKVDRDDWEPWRLTRPTWVAVLDEEIIGFSDLEADGHLDMMFVHPAHQGIGVASMLLTAVEDAARQQGLSRIFTEASITARPFFEKRGFVVDAQQQVTKEDETFINFRMHKFLHLAASHDKREQTSGFRLS
ncbi:GNAT family N-acetyltransferase [Rhizobium sp. TH2]|uniref:GNAT family N-acetyltransferase n=1 Tax=Rhizobium sp. TH2 TaxID=2775403 RepID=UPI0035BE3FA3